MSNNTPAQQKPQTAKGLLEQPNVKAKIEEMLGKRASAFISSVLQIVNSNALLRDADPMSIYQAAMMAATLDLPLNNNLGFAYIVPYNVKQPDGNYKKSAQFQMGYKGFVQLAQRTGQVKTIGASAIYEGQIKASNPLTGYEFDFTTKGEKVIGYAAYIELVNGFQKTIYMTIEDLNKHGVRYSKTFAKGYGLWKDDFDSMACKTVIKLLLSKFAPLSIEMQMQKAIVADQSVVRDAETMDVKYVDVNPAQVANEDQEILLLIESSKSVEHLEIIAQNVPEHLTEIYMAKLEAIQKKDEKGESKKKNLKEGKKGEQGEIVMP